MRQNKKQSPPPVPRMDDYITTADLALMEEAVRRHFESNPVRDSAIVGVGQYFRALDAYLEHCKTQEYVTIKPNAA